MFSLESLVSSMLNIDTVHTMHSRTAKCCNSNCQFMKYIIHFWKHITTGSSPSVISLQYRKYYIGNDRILDLKYLNFFFILNPMLWPEIPYVKVYDRSGGLYVDQPASLLKILKIIENVNDNT